MWQFIKKYFMPIYVSEIDQFLLDFDTQHDLSASQRKEVEKYRRLYKQRDEENPQ